ncbi:uncharacterized protein Bfra_011021 [Botrytis fragariae]|uniref:Uncharacterized protein n=1 Tax=Botrytis fragariae TaxID=1964551 RepID=A0A8H6EF20_9HELO|nr:uncharacterized protein Bfra_011021 [Botrytis fragariae]KAF5869821.1 hypothetical protein Bfra_011021 [Botrytis fragariae]
MEYWLIYNYTSNDLKTFINWSTLTSKINQYFAQTEYRNARKFTQQPHDSKHSASCRLPLRVHRLNEKRNNKLQQTNWLHGKLILTRTRQSQLQLERTILVGSLPVCPSQLLPA